MHIFIYIFLCSNFSQENLRRLLSTNDASSDFNKWCKKELQKFNTDVDGKRGRCVYDAMYVSYPLPLHSTLAIKCIKSIWCVYIPGVPYLF